MIKTPLNDYMKKHSLSQSEMADRVSLTQGAISKMLLRNRSIFVVEDAGALKLIEEKVVAPPVEEVSHQSAA
jgi:transcriptional regulator with XRE-family HTH domain